MNKNKMIAIIESKDSPPLSGVKFDIVVERGCGGFQTDTDCGIEYDCGYYKWDCDRCPIVLNNNKISDNKELESLGDAFFEDLFKKVC